MLLLADDAIGKWRTGQKEIGRNSNEGGKPNQQIADIQPSIQLGMTFAESTKKKILESRYTVC